MPPRIVARGENEGLWAGEEFLGCLTRALLAILSVALDSEAKGNSRSPWNRFLLNFTDQSPAPIFGKIAVLTWETALDSGGFPTAPSR